MILDHILTAGPVAWVLLCLSVIALTLLIERLWVHLSYPVFSQKKTTDCHALLKNNAFHAIEQLISTAKHGTGSALLALFNNRFLANDDRQEMATKWLALERNYLKSRLQLVALIGTLAPLLGLLGTVFGIINMFIAIAHNTGPVTPVLLAEGMWTAMVTTALGLIIAIPSLAASHGFDLLSQRRLQSTQAVLNQFNDLLVQYQNDNNASGSGAA